jgi:hypothetical protein
MPDASFVQTSFLGGVWSPLVQGRMDTQDYKEGLNRCFNAFPLEQGAWTRRPGFRFIAHTRGGRRGKLLDFDFTVATPYQMEFTDAFLRLYQGRSLVTTNDNVEITHVNTATPAKVFLANTIPAGWENGDTVVFNKKSTPCSAPLLCNRQFTLANKDTTNNTFTLKDALTGVDLDGSVVAYQVPGPTSEADGILKVFELGTPYTNGNWASVRAIQDIDNVLLLHGSFQPRVLRPNVAGSSTPFTIAALDLLDGPYLDQNTTTTTLALSATTGSVTVTASSIVGINGGTGFKSTDVGRLLRYQGGPTAWSGATTYAKAAIVLGSDGNIYSSLIGGNLNNNPTTDDGTRWEITGQRVVWTWLKITAFTSTTVVTATILGPDVPNGNATAAWRIGLYSNTTGWPSCAEYHEGRLWIASKTINRVDASKSNDFFNFSPTASDGTVADDNAIAAVANARGKNVIFWLLSTEDGLIAGTQAGEWRVKASSLDDPISPASTQFRRVSKYGCADIEPVSAAQTVLVQRQKRKIMAHVRASDDIYFAENLSITADSLTKFGIEEIVWQAEPNLNIWARRSDGVLLGCTFKKAQSSYALKSLHSIWGQSAVGWHEHEHGGGREFVSISSGPSFDGLSDTLYAITVDPDDIAQLHFVEMLMPIFDDQQLDWANSFVDAGAAPCCAKKFLVASGDPFNGIRLYGANYIVGKTVVPVVNGLDLGDRVVQTGGYVDIPFGSDPDGKFTEAFFNAIDQTLDYGAYETIVTFTTPVAPIVPAVGFYAMTTHIGPDADGVNGSYNGVCLVDQMYNNLNDRVWQIQLLSGGITAGIRKLDGPTGQVETHKTEAQVMAASGKTFLPLTSVYSPGPFSGGTTPGNGWIILWVTDGGAVNSAPIARVDAATLTLIDIYGTNSASFTPDPAVPRIPAVKSSACAVRAGRGDGHSSGNFMDYIAYGGLVSGASANIVVLIALDPGAMYYVDSNVVTGTDVDVCTGDWIGVDRHGVGTFIACGHPRYTAPEATIWNFYEFTVRRVNDVLDTLSRRSIGTLSPSQVDATWTNFSDFKGVMYDNADRNVLVFCETTDAVTNKFYLVKLNRETGAIVWKLNLTDPDIVLGFDGFREQEQSCQFINGTLSLVNTSPGTDKLYSFDTIAGTVATFSINPGHSISGGQYWQPYTASLTCFGSYTDAGTPDPTARGQWLANGSPAFTSVWHRIFFWAPAAQSVPSYPATLVTEILIPDSLGFNYISEGQLLRPDFGQDAGARNGPAFGKVRRIQEYAAETYRTRKMSIGADFVKMRPITFKSAGGTPIAAPGLFSGITCDTLDCDYSYEGQIAWRSTRPYNCTVTAIGGFLSTQDK